MTTRIGRKSWFESRKPSLPDMLRHAGIEDGLIEPIIRVAGTLKDRNGSPNPRNTLDVIERAAEAKKDLRALLMVLETTQEGENPYKHAKKEQTK